MIAALFVVGAIWAARRSSRSSARRCSWSASRRSSSSPACSTRASRAPRSATWCIELRTRPAPGELRDALARALRDPTLDARLLAAGVRDLRRPGRPARRSCPARRTPDDDGDRPRDGSASPRCVHDRSLDDEPELLDGVSRGGRHRARERAAASRAAARGSRSSAARARGSIEAGQKERQRLERNLHDGAQQRLIALSLELSLLEPQARAATRRPARLDQARGARSPLSLEELREIARGIHPAVVTGHGLAVALESLAARAPVPVAARRSISTSGCPSRSRWPRTTSSPRASRTSASTRGATSATVDVARTRRRARGRGRRRRHRRRRHRARVGPARARRPGRGARRPAARSGRPRGGGTRVRAEIPCA